MACAVSLEPPPVMILARPAATSLPTSTRRIFSGSVSVRRLARRAGDDDAVGAGGDDVVDVLLDVGPVDLAVGGEWSHERDEHLTEGIS